MDKAFAKRSQEHDLGEEGRAKLTANVVNHPQGWLSESTCAAALRIRTDSPLGRASLKIMSLGAPATLLYLWLLPRAPATANTETLADTLGVSFNTVIEARRELVAAGLLRAERDSVLEALRHDAVRNDRFPNWQPKKVKFPEEVRAMSPAAKALYLYVAGRPGVTRSQLAEDLGLSYDTVLRSTNKLTPWLETEGANPMHYRLRKAKP